MHRYLFAALAVLMVGACQTASAPPPIAVPTDNVVVKWIETVKDTTETVCGFIPESSFLKSLYAKISGNDYLAYAEEICAALKRPQAFGAGRFSTPRVRGFVIRGHWS